MLDPFRFAKFIVRTELVYFALARPQRRMDGGAPCNARFVPALHHGPV